ncbi:MAG TPA: 2'-deoxycytidine 5'-triphosphate deaminase, partial [Lacipirellulaceae bacterium]|nr:2'-deoxycytidine 5'-triphosphate deaminase [Lacipirellulaceae bacterium]
MGILSRRAICKRIETDELKIVPAPTEEDFGSDSIDVHLGDRVYEWIGSVPGSVVSISLWETGANEFNYTPFSKQYLRDVPPDNAGIITLRPKTFYLADLRQHTTLPPDVAMHIQGKSSLARLGVLVHLTAPHAHAGWTGRLTLEIYNLGPFNIEMKPGMTIGQLT